jgi:hypothetical protein
MVVTAHCALHHASHAVFHPPVQSHALYVGGDTLTTLLWFPADMCMPAARLHSQRMSYDMVSVAGRKDSHRRPVAASAVGKALSSIVEPLPAAPCGDAGRWVANAPGTIAMSKDVSVDRVNVQLCSCGGVGWWLPWSCRPLHCPWPRRKLCVQGGRMPVMSPLHVAAAVPWLWSPHSNLLLLQLVVAVLGLPGWSQPQSCSWQVVAQLTSCKHLANLPGKCVTTCSQTHTTQSVRIDISVRAIKA